MNGESAAESTPAKADQPASKKKYHRPMIGPLCEVLILVGLLAAAGLALKAGPEPSGDALAHVHDFYRRTVVGMLQGHLLPIGYLLLAVAVCLGLLTAWPTARPEVRAAVAAYGMILMLAPVINYGPQVEMLAMYPEDVQILTADLPPAQQNLDTTSFQPLLPVTWPLGFVALLLIVWAFATPTADWPAAVKAGAVVTLLMVAGGAWLTHLLNQARGNALSFPYTQWPHITAALWILGQLGVAATGAAAVGVDGRRSRAAAVLVAVLCVVTALLAGGVR